MEENDVNEFEGRREEGKANKMDIMKSQRQNHNLPKILIIQSIDVCFKPLLWLFISKS
jgi:hypothetical protein